MGMLNTWFSIWLQRLSVFLLLGFNPVLGQTISLLKDEALLQQRDCVRYCLGGEDNFEDLQNFLGCPDTNVCLCREDIRPSASAALETCIRSVYTTCKSGTDMRRLLRYTIDIARSRHLLRRRRTLHRQTVERRLSLNLRLLLRLRCQNRQVRIKYLHRAQVSGSSSLPPRVYSSLSAPLRRHPDRRQIRYRT